MTDSSMLARAATLADALSKAWPQEALDALDANEDASIGLAIAHGLTQGWLATPLPHEAMTCLDAAESFVDSLEWDEEDA
jgi:hypothetical protein